MLFFIYSFLFFCIAITVLVFFLEFVPRMNTIYQHRFKSEQTLQTISHDVEKQILYTSFKMAKSNQVTMVWESPKHSFTEKVIALFRKKSSHTDEFKKYNYPRAFLLLGIVNYLIKENNKKQLGDFKNLFDGYITSEGKASFELNRIDQVPFGEVALQLYKFYGEKKYLVFADKIYQYLVQNIDSSDGIIDYRPGIKVVLNDMIGLCIPFLLQYSKITNTVEAKNIAEQQMNYFITYGTDVHSYLPAHGIAKKTTTKVGSANWGRGIGWYILGLSACAESNQDYQTQFIKLEKSLYLLKNKEQLWSQYPGSSEKFDASATLMILYAILCNKPTYLTKNEFLNLFLPYLSQDGVVLQTSGDTVGLNEYSKTFGPSELSQGFLLLLLSKLKNNE